MYKAELFTDSGALPIALPSDENCRQPDESLLGETRLPCMRDALAAIVHVT